MYLLQPTPEIELIILDYPERLEIMHEQTAMHYAAAREALIDRVFDGGTFNHDHPDAPARVAQGMRDIMAGYLGDQEYIKETEQARADD